MGDWLTGGSSQPNIVIPPAETPRAFQTVIPQKSYQDLAESMNRTEKEYNRLVDQRYDMTGTAADLGAKQRGIEMQEAASYASSLPGQRPDKGFKGTPDGGDAIAAPAEKKTLAQETADLRAADTKEYYLAAVKKAKETPRSYMPETENPGFAQNPASMYLPKAEAKK